MISDTPQIEPNKMNNSSKSEIPRNIRNQLINGSQKFKMLINSKNLRLHHKKLMKARGFDYEREIKIIEARNVGTTSDESLKTLGIAIGSRKKIQELDLNFSW